MQYARSLVIFRQDLRVQDNTALREAVQQSQEVIPLFVIDRPDRHGFVAAALGSLEEDLRTLGSGLIIRYGDPETIIPEIVKEYHIDAVRRNKSYGPGSLTRDVSVTKRCERQGIDSRACGDYLMHDPAEIPPRKVFWPFFKLRQKTEKRKILPLLTHIPSPDLPRSGIHSGAIQGSVGERLATFDFAHYEETRNFPAIDGSSRMSIFLRFWLISIRQLYRHTINLSPTYISELAWRDFWNHIAVHFPYSREHAFQTTRQHIIRDNNPDFFDARKNWRTGYPIVDAAMRQLKSEGRMHNRCRMIVASFLTKDALVDRAWWEKYFAEQLLDYDANVNMWNRQRAASVGADPKPLRIFSPMLQSERFDPDCIYIKKYIPELASYSSKEIHNPLTYNLGYASPILDHYLASAAAKVRYQRSKTIALTYSL